MTHDLIIVGTGPAGLSAGLLAGRYGLDTILLEREDLGGGLVNAHRIETYPGFPDGISGPELRSNIVDQLREYDLTLELAEVTTLDADDGIRVETTRGDYDSRTAIVASGGSRRRPSVPGTARYDGRGIFDCAICDGPLYRDERVAILGGGEEALMDSVYLSDLASEVIVIEENSALSGSKHMCEVVSSVENVEVRHNTEIAAIVGDDVVGGLELVDTETGVESFEGVAGLLVRVGRDPNVDFLPEALATNERNEVAVNNKLATNIPGVFAAGTVRENSVPRVASAIGDGVMAFHSAKQYLD